MSDDSVCLVTASDFRAHFRAQDALDDAPPIWDGHERRVGTDDRRHGHDRRWTAQRERRLVLQRERRRG